MIKTSSVYQFQPGLQKLRHCLARRDSFTAKEPGPVTGVTAPPTLSAHTRNRYG
jgi:hypothetical protein